MEFKRPETLIATGKSGKRICKESGRSGTDEKHRRYTSRNRQIREVKSGLRGTI